MGALRDAERGSLEDHGFVCLEGQSRDDLVNLAFALGTPVEVRTRGLVQALVPTTRELAAPRSLSAAHGLSAFPLHTDFAHWPEPPRWVLLRSTGASTAVTLLADWDQVELSVSERRVIEDALWVVNPGHRRFVAPMLSQGRLRYDAGCMRIAHERWEGAAALVTGVLSAATQQRITWQPGRVLVIDNARMLHGREAILDRGVRLLERVVVREAP